MASATSFARSIKANRLAETKAWRIESQREDMPLPPDVQAAKDRMEKAQAALQADVETGAAARARRKKLIDELQVATDNFVAKIEGR
jgi:hypothetical protein